MKVLAIIVTYNGLKWYDRCFSSLEASSMPVDIFVVDNASKDGTTDLIKFKYPKIHLIESSVNLGFGQANNVGLKYALEKGYDYVFLLNQDAWIVQADTISKLIECQSKDSRYGILSPLQLYGSGEQIDKDMEFHIVEYQTSKNDLISDLCLQRQLKDVYDINYICAASWLIPCDVLKEIGGFDPIFFHYGEDNNYMQRIIFHGYKMGICPGASVCHDIEYRDANYGLENNNWKKYLLVECADINQPFYFIKRVIKNFSLFYTQLLIFKFKASLVYLNISKYLLKNRRKIDKSRSVNCTRGSHWLFN